MDLANLLHGAPAPKPYSYTYIHKRPQAPLFSPFEETKCSLPSISSLLEGADSAQNTQQSKRQRMSPSARDRDVRYDAINLPPTPPLRPSSGLGNISSPESSKSNDHFHRSSISSTGSVSAATMSGPYASPAPSVSSYTSTTQDAAPMYYRQTPTYQQATPTITQPCPSPSLISPVTPAWQHHHYFPPSSTAPYQQTHDRYICRTCHKAFSRPSSLRIHSHSHTGEKPFRCTHVGCGKAFSVRSNMKRHERGCHSGHSAVQATALVS
ncbi:hypothetical protein N7495_007543 [Penicillium taxi]|uniref:uncharacterized protein n=1 Tax=Penicillium taxi TaxID=168475 RepID=UPI002545211B|nr:uncharacterized protein N7495_007543 [Penicillium taxi]KAJ5887502.1 hypothetical protein N7495_007543 [Penicillium taxi]